MKIRNKDRYYYIRQFEISFPIDVMLSNCFPKNLMKKHNQTFRISKRYSWNDELLSKWLCLKSGNNNRTFEYFFNLCGYEGWRCLLKQIEQCWMYFLSEVSWVKRKIKYKI